MLIGSGLYDDVEKEVGEPTSKLRRRLLFFFAEPLLILIGCIEYPNIYLHPSYIAGCPLEIPPLSNLSASYPHRVPSLKKKKRKLSCVSEFRAMCQKTTTFSIFFLLRNWPRTLARWYIERFGNTKCAMDSAISASFKSLIAIHAWCCTVFIVKSDKDV